MDEVYEEEKTTDLNYDEKDLHGGYCADLGFKVEYVNVLEENEAPIVATHGGKVILPLGSCSP